MYPDLYHQVVVAGTTFIYYSEEEKVRKFQGEILIISSQAANSLHYLCVFVILTKIVTDDNRIGFYINLHLDSWVWYDHYYNKREWHK
jgi:hypothetical protein